MTLTLTRTRPTFAPGYGIAADPAGMLEWSWAEARLLAARNYWIVSVKPDGAPHAAPVWGIWYADRLIFGADPASRKARNFAGQPKVVMHLESGDECLIIDGEAALVSDEIDLHAAAAVYNAKYQIEALDPTKRDSVFMMTPRSALAWLETDFPTTATKFTFR